MGATREGPYSSVQGRGLGAYSKANPNDEWPVVWSRKVRSRTSSPILGPGYAGSEQDQVLDRLAPLPILFPSLSPVANRIVAGVAKTMYEVCEMCGAAAVAA